MQILQVTINMTHCIPFSELQPENGRSLKMEEDKEEEEEKKMKHIHHKLYIADIEKK